jgi:hypothetical protein
MYARSHTNEVSPSETVHRLEGEAHGKCRDADGTLLCGWPAAHDWEREHTMSMDCQCGPYRVTGTNEVIHHKTS